MEIILSQNYLMFKNKIYQPEISMGSPISSTIAENFLQYLEDIHIKQLRDTKNITFYTRYVDDILIIYDTKQTNKHQPLQKIYKSNTYKHKTQHHT